MVLAARPISIMPAPLLIARPAPVSAVAAIPRAFLSPGQPVRTPPLWSRCSILLQLSAIVPSRLGALWIVPRREGWVVLVRVVQRRARRRLGHSTARQQSRHLANKLLALDA